MGIRFLRVCGSGLDQYEEGAEWEEGEGEKKGKITKSGVSKLGEEGLAWKLEKLVLRDQEIDEEEGWEELIEELVKVRGRRKLIVEVGGSGKGKGGCWEGGEWLRKFGVGVE